MADRDEDVRFMAAAIRLSRWHLGQTASNPSVGCIIVKDGIIVGRGVTALSGRPHAEPQALAEAGEAARGATAYVTLEPCSHHGKTPPCAEALIASGVARVVVALTDPDERVSGRGLRMLADAGIAVQSGVLADEAESQLESYLNRQRSKRPQVILKLAVSADGMVGRLGEGQVAITGREARAQSHVLRAESDAILVGIGTVLADDPELTCRLPGMEMRSPLRIVLDRRLELPLASKLVGTIAVCHGLLVVGGPDADSEKKAALEGAGAEVIEISDDVGKLLNILGERGISSLIVEGGAKTAGRFLSEGVVDRIALFSSPVTVGTGGIKSPITEQTVPDGFVLRRRERLGADQMSDYIHASKGH
ncbi:bifunctional diaminohydroxyphosphoribosylaminopyrimidine deaminase/5-amino-6-(5-phosphoribosylamino)uracil reductase RibD [Rhizobium sp. KVB221]|uniref:Riboflavin biosynthesis protein RibD n=1 Tax=Rhizobium setariae TaxID=2801340 RepID=A0A936YR93_9HYPH|nr:bifunctional diaminohydroxyphosphoribosylaminopyrimidine deaminase/5-amino-6-(5-phosphoribosylamino)uracil reductase RibD [Rhizobium setariae]